eukprot:5161061-Alexandrium_andersonii.AAC.1
MERLRASCCSEEGAPSPWSPGGHPPQRARPPLPGGDPALSRARPRAWRGQGRRRRGWPRTGGRQEGGACASRRCGRRGRRTDSAGLRRKPSCARL